jgi:hypothetical protein
VLTPFAEKVVAFQDIAYFLVKSIHKERFCGGTLAEGDDDPSLNDVCGQTGF